MKGRIVGASAAIGHLLREHKDAKPAQTAEKEIVIIGGGVSGLSAARYLQKNGFKSLTLLELEDHTGGNAAHGENELSRFPWGAHYIPVPNNDLTEYLHFLEEAGVITGWNENKLPVYNDLYLCFDPQERLYINGKWQDGLVPHYGVPTNELRQIEAFLKKMDEYRHLKDANGKDAFAIPVDLSSREEIFVLLDRITMKEWLLAEGFDSEYLHQYVNYCCRDDFGTPLHLVSAWAGIHYFASRKGRGANAGHSDVLTWPEGNGFLVEHLQKDLYKHVKTNSLALKVQERDGMVEVDWFDVKARRMERIIAKYCIIAAPQFVAAKLLQDQQRAAQVKQTMDYAPWMVANLKVTTLEERSGAPASWDNVLHNSYSLGYVEATHELLQQRVNAKNITYYLPLTESSPTDERKKAQSKTHEDWTNIIMQDLQKVHPGIRHATEELNVMIWGHAMVQPRPGMIHGPARIDLSKSIGSIHFAHS
ncbi:MAG: FAD-dependent oxidoreductase, partial [Sphingobacteriales bacterium]